MAMVKVLRHCIGVATDSGGLQEEAATLGVPCAVLRNVTDRPESVEAGVAKLFPPTPDGMTQALNMLLTRTIPRTPVSVYGTPAAAHNIAELLVNLTDSGNIR
jgi:UDP-N-acetylglucosamine 2-epimerase (non-hydrolysing)